MTNLTILLFSAVLSAATDSAPSMKDSCRSYDEIMPFLTSAYGLKPNPYGVHLLAGGNRDRIDMNLDWAHTLIGDGGHAKELFSGFNKNIRQPKGEWIHFVNGCYKRKLIPICRIASNYQGSSWVKPEPDAPGDYTSWAEAIKSVVKGLPKMDGVPLYIEVWNEPGFTVEWSGQPSATEYAHFLVDVTRALRSLNDDRIVILNGGLSELEKMFKAVPESVWAFDVLSSHPYPHGRPPESNNHDGTTEKPTDLTIDGYTLELEVMARYGRPKMPVMITETGYDLGNQTFARLGYPIIDEDLRADYMMRAFRDFWIKWPELVAVLPFEFSSGGDWSRFDWVNPKSGIDERGWPTLRYKQYDYVAHLAKPNDPSGAISGKVLQTDLGVAVDGVTVALDPGDATSLTDLHGVYMFPDLNPGSYTLSFERTGFTSISSENLQVAAGKNTVLNTELAAIGEGRIRGRVVEGTTGKPIAGVPVTLIPGKRSDTTAKNGSFKLSSVVPSRYIVEASMAGFHPHRIRDVVIAKGTTVDLTFKISENQYPKTENLFRNAGFEEGDRAGLAIGWEIRRGSDHPEIYSIDKTVSRTGDASQSLRANRGEIKLIEQYTHYTTIEPGKTYLAGVWVKTKGLKRGEGQGVYVLGSLFADSMAGLGDMESSRLPDGDNDWTLLTITAKAPPKSGRLRLTLFADADEGTVWLDDAFAGEQKHK